MEQPRRASLKWQLKSSTLPRGFNQDLTVQLLSETAGGRRYREVVPLPTVCFAPSWLPQRHSALILALASL